MTDTGWISIGGIVIALFIGVWFGRRQIQGKLRAQFIEDKRKFMKDFKKAMKDAMDPFGDEKSEE